MKNPKAPLEIDTIYFLTDGQPFGGKKSDWKLIIADITEMNKLRRVKINCIGIGEHLAESMRRLAQLNGGTYVKK